MIHCLYRLAERKAVVPDAVDKFLGRIKTASPAS
jgi:hypothetical protein